MPRYAWEYDGRYDSGFAPAWGAGRGRYDTLYSRGWMGGAAGPRGFGGQGGYGYGGGSLRRGGYADYELRHVYSSGGRGGRGYGGGAAMREGPSGDVDSVRAAEIMTRNPEAVLPDTPLLEVARRMRDLDVGVIPVVDDADSFRLRGVVTDRDIAIRAAAEGKDMKKTPVREVMSANPETVSEHAHVRDVFSVMKRARVRRVPVVDDQERLVGIIAQADLAVNYAGLDLQRETEVEEVIERISEPARPRWGRDGAPADGRGRTPRRFAPAMDIDLPDRVRSGWRTLRREARELMGRGYDRGWR